MKQNKNFQEDSDVLSSIERDVLRRTQQAHQQLLRNQRNGTAAQVLAAQLVGFDEKVSKSVRLLKNLKESIYAF